MKTFNLLATCIMLASAILKAQGGSSDAPPGQRVVKTEDSPVKPVLITVEEMAALMSKSNCPKNLKPKGRSGTECSDEGFKHPSKIADISEAFIAVPRTETMKQRDEYVCRVALKTDKYGMTLIPGKAWRENDQWKCVYPYGGVENVVGEGYHHEILTGQNYKYVDLGKTGQVPPNPVPVGVRIEPEQPKDLLHYSGIMHTGPDFSNVRYKFLGRVPFDQTTKIWYTYDDGSEYIGQLSNISYETPPIQVLTCT